MKRLTKSQETARAQLTNDLREAQAEVEGAASDVNAMIGEKLNVAIANYNEALTAIIEFRDEVVGEMETYYDEKSEKWQESEAASNYSTWKDQWESMDLDEIDEVNEVESPDMDHADNMDALPSEVEE